MHDAFTDAAAALPPAPPQAPAASPVRGAPRLSPVGARLRQLAGDAPLLKALGPALGIDLTGLTDKLSALPAHAVKTARLEAVLELDDARTLSFPLPDGRVLRFEVPRAPYGIVVRTTVDIGLDEQGPSLKGASLVFDTPAHARGAAERGLASIHLPAITNPSVLKPAPTTLAERLNAAATDTAADVRLRGVRVDGDDQVTLDGHIYVLGMPHQDLQEAAGQSLPRVPTRLAAPSTSAASPEAHAGAAGRGSAGVASGPVAPRSLSPMALTELFAFMSSGGEVTLDIEGADGVRASARASLAIDRDLRLRADMRVGGELLGQEGGVHVAAQADLYNAHGAIAVDLGAAPQAPDVGKPAELPAGRAVTWTRDGVQLAGLPVDDILPVRLAPSRGAAAPRVGTAAFRAEVAALLDETAPAHAGCDVAYFARGDDVLRERLQLIASAGRGDTVLLQTFIFKDDITGGRIIDELIAAKSRGATVKVLMDAVGSAKEPADAVRGPPAYRRLKDAGVDVALIASPAVPLQELARRLGAVLERVPADPAAHARLARHAPALHRLITEQLDPSTRIDARLPALLERPEEAIALAVELACAGVELRSGAANQGLESAVVRALIDVTTRSADLLRSLARDHRKQLIVFGPGDDLHAHTRRAGPTVLMGGNNVGDDYHLERDAADFDPAHHTGLPLWNDAETRITSAGLARQASLAFARTWRESSGRDDAPVAAPAASSSASARPGQAAPAVAGGGETLRLVTHRPLDAAHGDARHETTNLLLKSLDGTGRGDRITIENPYFHPIPALKDAMIRAARRGAQITVVTNGPHENNDARLVSRLSRRFVLKDLVNEPGIAVYETRGDADPIHRKTFLVQTRGGQDLWVLGSQNLDSLSTRINREVVVVGGSALRAEAGPADAVGRGLAEAARTDTDPGVSTRLRPADLQSDDVTELAADWARSLLLPLM